MKFLPAPKICVWELTLACNAACIHCGSSAGMARSRELDAHEALRVCDDLVRMGTRQVTLSGGEPLLRDGWADIAQRLARGGVLVDMISNGILLGEQEARTLAQAGVASVTLSVDGPEAIHDALRGVCGSFGLVMKAAEAVRSVGLPVGAATQVCTRNLPFLAELEQQLVDGGFSGWQLQLTDRMGRCADHPDLPLAPDAVPKVVQFILEVARRGRIPAYGADNIGWMLPCEPELRSLRRPPDRFFPGCQAGLSVIGITSDGTVRGCLSMASAFDEANIRSRTLLEIWRDPGGFAYNRAFQEEQLTADCARCALRRVCRAGCKSLAWAATGQLGSNPYCARLHDVDRDGP